jgi:hypothetical protein
MRNSQQDARGEGAQDVTNDRARDDLASNRFRVPDTATAALIGALANYLSDTHDKSEIRVAINAWRHDRVNAGLRPEQLLVEFKEILVDLSPGQYDRGYEQWLVDRREIILMCIEEYYRNDGDSPS